MQMDARFNNFCSFLDYFAMEFLRIIALQAAAYALGLAKTGVADCYLFAIFSCLAHFGQSSLSNSSSA